MKKIFVPLAIILLFAALISGGAYAVAQVTADSSPGQANGADHVEQPAQMDGAGKIAGEGEFGRHGHDDLASERALPELIRNLLVISLVVLITVAFQKVTRLVRRRRPAAG